MQRPSWKAYVAGLAILALWVAAAAAPVAAAPVQKGEADTRTVNGQVIDRDSNPISRAVVYLKNTRNLQVRTYITNDQGNFHFQGLNPNTDYQIHAEHEGASSPTRTISSFDSRKQIQITLKIEKK